jgi:hypothetical protein
MQIDEILIFVLTGLARQGQVFVSVEGFRIEMVTDQKFLISLKAGPIYLCEISEALRRRRSL